MLHTLPDHLVAKVLQHLAVWDCVKLDSAYGSRWRPAAAARRTCWVARKYIGRWLGKARPLDVQFREEQFSPTKGELLALLDGCCSPAKLASLLHMWTNQPHTLVSDPIFLPYVPGLPTSVP